MESKIITTLDKHNEALRIAIGSEDREAQIESVIEINNVVFQIKTIVKKLYTIPHSSQEHIAVINK